MYLDDIGVMGRTFDENLKNMGEVPQRISIAGQAKYFRYVTADGISTDEGKIQAVKDWPRPYNLYEQCSFLGLCTYYRRFVPNFASVAAFMSSPRN